MTQICINVTLFPHDWIQFSVSFFPLGAKSSILPLQGNSRSASLEFDLFQEITQWIHCLNVITWKCMLLYWGIFPTPRASPPPFPEWPQEAGVAYEPSWQQGWHLSCLVLCVFPWLVWDDLAFGCWHLSPLCPLWMSLPHLAFQGGLARAAETSAPGPGLAPQVFSLCPVVVPIPAVFYLLAVIASVFTTGTGRCSTSSVPCFSLGKTSVPYVRLLLYLDTMWGHFFCVLQSPNSTFLNYSRISLFSQAGVLRAADAFS